MNLSIMSQFAWFVGFCDLGPARHRQVFRIQRRRDGVLKQVRETAIAADREPGAAGEGGEAGAARNRAVATLLLLNGLRRGEVSRIALADWSPATPKELAIRGKGRTERETIVLAPQAAKALAAWMKVWPDVNYLLLNGQKRLAASSGHPGINGGQHQGLAVGLGMRAGLPKSCLLYTSDAADE